MAQGLDLTHLDQWIRDHVPAFEGDLKAEKFAGGQSNPTFKLTAGENSYVLRRKPMGTLLASAHAVDREFKVLSALAPTNVPVPTPSLCAKTITSSVRCFTSWNTLKGVSFGIPLCPKYPMRIGCHLRSNESGDGRHAQCRHPPGWPQ